MQPVTGIVLKNIINGTLRDAADGKIIEVLNPYNQDVVGTVPASTESEIRDALLSSQTAQKKWEKLPAQKRGEYLLELAALLEKHREELALLLTSEHGKPLAQAREEVDTSASFFRYAAESARRIQGEIFTSERENEQIWIQRVPYGVTAGITAWNYPLALTARKAGNSLVCGNSMIIKPPSDTPLTVMKFGELIAKESHLPAGVLNFITGSGRKIGEGLVKNNITKLVTLTGSTRAGLSVYEAASKNCVEVRLELGGKAPFIVMEDADADYAAKCAALAKYNNCGQICTCNERMYVHEAVYDQFLKEFLKETKKVVVGDPLDPQTTMGPKVNQAETLRIKEMVHKAEQQGAKLLLDMTPEALPTQNGNWLYPQVFEVTDPANLLMQEEIFGPVAVIMKVKSFDEALQYANDCSYGLSSYLFTNRSDYIMRSIRELSFGEVYVNRENGELINGFHNGFKLSGTGGEDGIHGLEGYLQKKTFYVNYNHECSPVQK